MALRKLLLRILPIWKRSNESPGMQPVDDTIYFVSPHARGIAPGSASSLPCFTAQSVSKSPREGPALITRQTDQDPEPPVRRGNGRARNRILDSPWCAVRQAWSFGSKGLAPIRFRRLA